MRKQLPTHQDISQNNQLLYDMNQNQPHISSTQSMQSASGIDPKVEPMLKNSAVMYIWGIGMAFGAFIMGYFFVIVSVLTAAMNKFNQNQQENLNLSVMFSICTTAMPLGGLLGSLVYSRILSAVRSQNRLLTYTSLLIAICLTIQSISLNLKVYSFIRLLQGFLCGIYGNLIPSYIMSVTPTKISGQMGSLNQIMITIGIATAYGMGYILDQSNLLHPVYWRLCVLLPLPFCVLQLFVCQYFSFDSIQRHIRRRQWNKLYEYLDMFYQSGTFNLERLIISKNIDTKTIIGGIPKSKNQLPKQLSVGSFQQNISQSHSSSEAETPGLRLRRTLAIVVSVVSQFSGINSILFYSNQLFLDISGGDADYAVRKSLHLGLFQIVVTLFSGAVMDRFGRRTLMIGGQSLVVIALLAAYSVLQFGEKGAGNQIVALAIFVHMAGFSLSLGPITVVYISQIMTDISPYMTLIWIQTIVISFASNLMMEKFGTGKVFLFFAIVSTLGLMYIIKFMVETKGKTRKEVVRCFDGLPQIDSPEGNNCLKNIMELQEQKKDYSKVSDDQN